MRAKKDYVKGIYCLEFIKNENGKSIWDLVFVNSLTGDPTGSDMMNVSLVLEENITCDQLKEAIKAVSEADVPVKLHPEVTALLKVKVVAE